MGGADQRLAWTGAGPGVFDLNAPEVWVERGHRPPSLIRGAAIAVARRLRVLTVANAPMLAKHEVSLQDRHRASLRKLLLASVKT